MSRIEQTVAGALTVCMCVVGVPVPAHAELIATDRVEVTVQARPSGREILKSLLDRADVRAAVEGHGVSAVDAKTRVAALSDAEVEELASRFESLPAGGHGVEGVLWLAFLVFLILLITDILGFTKVFPFTRPAK